ncbi:hypothetical protein FRZ67_10185 [Panacibacter ginsenosidivorans]|uniref:Lipocalin-like domain-containing protein n=1 Tax=Panacibacter ginsenosidivorans TaxID=1813871 RepID=A0A5B8V9V7_9BACT|nr:hypothetical protein [Panacibacter ginsenosidivorans]QEC67641.1 hypothetical protein FRZ67_10185 [Panacibacter ginsenosidivorans]
MKKLMSLLLASALIVSCTKSDVVKPSTVSTTDNSNAVTAKNTLALLTANTWIYVRYYTSSDSIGSGTLAYKRGRVNNIIALDNNTVKFNIDGTVDEFDNDGNYIPGTWSFTNDGKTSMVVNNSYGTFYSDILKLSATKFVWNGPYSLTTGIMQPK